MCTSILKSVSSKSSSENPDTVLVKLTPEARAEWEAVLKSSTEAFVKDLNPALLEAVSSTASKK